MVHELLKGTTGDTACFNRWRSFNPRLFFEKPVVERGVGAGPTSFEAGLFLGCILLTALAWAVRELLPDPLGLLDRIIERMMTDFCNDIGL